MAGSKFTGRARASGLRFSASTPQLYPRRHPARLTSRSSRPRVVASAMCYALRLHMSAAPPQGGLTPALGDKTNMAMIRKLKHFFGISLVTLGLLFLMLAVFGNQPIFLVWVSDHTYLRIVPAPWWQSAISGLVLLSFGGYFLLRSRSSRNEGMPKDGPVA